MSSRSAIRPIGIADVPAIGRVAYETGFFGDSARVFFPDRTLFTDLWVRPYVPLGLPGFVALHEGEVVGYIVGATDESAYRRSFARVLPALLLRTTFAGYPHLAACLPYLLRVATHPPVQAPASKFPAHLHLNVLRDVRGRKFGAALLDAYLDLLRANGVRGVHLSTTLRNETAIGLYESRGFTEHARRPSRLWTPWTGRTETHVVLTLPLTAVA